MRFLLKSRRFWLLPVALAMACSTWAIAALLGENEDVEDIYNRRLHQVLVERQATDLQDLAERFLKDQESYLWIAPPDPDFILFQPGETIPILDLKAFPASFIDNLAGEVGGDGVVRFPVWIYEDAGSPGREIVIESLEQKVIVRIGRDREYSPEWFVRALYPALDTYSEWWRDRLTACYDPARVCMRYDLLVGEDNLIEFVWARSIEAARLVEEREAAAMMRSGEGGSVSNLQFTAIGPTTNGTIELTLAWPDEGLSTNVVDIFACTDLCAKDWVLADTLTLDMQTNRSVWVDAESTNHVTRFYDAWTHHDSDGDGNPRTRVFVVPIAQALEWPVDSVVVRALISPNMDESDLPDCMSLQGGSGGDKLTRYVSRTTQAGPSKTEFTFSCGGTNAGFTTTVYVYDAKVGLFADEGDLQNLEVGHSWGQYSLDAFAQELVPEEHRDYIDYIGFWPSIAGNPSCVGDVRLGVAAVGAHWPSGQKMYPIRFAPLAFALSQVKASDDSPPWYHLFNYNCTDYAIGIGEIVYVYSMDPDGVSTPWEFSAWLNNH